MYRERDKSIYAIGEKQNKAMLAERKDRKKKKKERKQHDGRRTAISTLENIFISFHLHKDRHIFIEMALFTA